MRGEKKATTVESLFESDYQLRVCGCLLADYYSNSLPSNRKNLINTKNDGKHMYNVQRILYWSITNKTVTQWTRKSCRWVQWNAFFGQWITRNISIKNKTRTNKNRMQKKCLIHYQFHSCVSESIELSLYILLLYFRAGQCSYP